MWRRFLRTARVLSNCHGFEHPSVAALFGRLQGSEHFDAFADLAGREFLAQPATDETGLAALRRDIAGGLKQLELAWWDAELAAELRREGGPDNNRLRELYAGLSAMKSAVQGRP